MQNFFECEDRELRNMNNRRLSQSRSLGFLVCSLALRAHCRATRSKARLVSKSRIIGVIRSVIFVVRKEIGKHCGWI